MSSLLDLDQIAIDEQSKRERIAYLYEALRLMTSEALKWGSFIRPMPEWSSNIVDKIKSYKDELRGYGVNVD